MLIIPDTTTDFLEMKHERGINYYFYSQLMRQKMLGSFF